MVAKSNFLIFLITLGDYLPEKPWFVRVNRHASRRSIARSIIFELKNRILLHCGEFTISRRLRKVSTILFHNRSKNNSKNSHL